MVKSSKLGCETKWVNIQFSLPHRNLTYQFPTEGKGEEEPLEITGGSVPPSSPTPPPPPPRGGGGRPNHDQ